MRLVGGIFTSLLWMALAAPHPAQAQESCTTDQGIGVERTIDIDTRGGPWFGAPHGNPDLLRPGEVVLTFDDGPNPASTRAILAALAAQCTKATFFVVGEMAAAHPEVVREVAAQGHTIGTHTWSHANLRRVSEANMKAQIESAFVAAEKAAGVPIAPFFRYPYLANTHAAEAYLRTRDIAQFAIDIDSLDWRTHNAQSVVRQVMARLNAEGRGIILLHDIHPSTALAVPTLLARLKDKGFKIVHVRPVAPAQVLVASATPPPRSASAYRMRRRSVAIQVKTTQQASWPVKWPPW